MKNQIIKKIMAYLLVGAMVITTPMTASAAEGILPEAYGLDQSGAKAENGKNTGTGTGTGTSTSTNTQTIDVPLPPAIDEQLPHIIGVALDKTSLEFQKVGDNAVLQARALFDDYDAAGEEMQWVIQAEKKKIEGEIHWYCDDFSVATIASVWDVNGDVSSEQKAGPRAMIQAVGEGVTTVYAWIEADGKQYANAPQKPTEGDYIATATVTVRDRTVTDIKFDDTQVPWVVKRQYDLTQYTKIVFGEREKTVDEYSGSIVYGIAGYVGIGTIKPTVKATLTDNGVLKITKGKKGEVINITITTESGFSKTFPITLEHPNPVKKLTAIDSRFELDMGSTYAGEKAKENYSFNQEEKRVQKSVTIKIATIDGKDDTGKEKVTTDDLVWTSNKKTIADVKRTGYDTAVIYTTGNIGTAKITVKATSGKSASFTVTVVATPSDIELGDAITYTGKPVTIPAILTGENGLTLPTGKTKLTYDLKDIEGGIAADKAKRFYTAVNKSKGIFTPKLLLSDDGNKTYDNEVIVGVTVKGVLKNGRTVVFEKSADAQLTIKQSNVKDLVVDVKQYKDDNWEIKETLGKDDTKKTLTDLYVGNTYKFMPTPGTGSSEGAANSIVWASTGKGIKSVMDGVDYKSELTGSTNATVKATYYELVETNKVTPKKKMKTITIKPIQMAQSLVLDKPVQVVSTGVNRETQDNSGLLKDTKVTIKVKALNPKNSKDKIQWKVLTADDTNTDDKTPRKPIDGVKVTSAIRNGYTSVDNKVVDTNGNEVPSASASYDAKNKSLKITIPKGTKAGSVIKVGAYAQGGAVAYGYIYIVKPTAKISSVEVSADATPTQKNGRSVKNNWDLKLDKYANISAKLTITGATTEVENLGAKWTIGDTSAYEHEYLTYTLDKKSALIVRVDKNGKITPIKPGKATITIKTASGKKSAKVIINVVS